VVDLGWTVKSVQPVVSIGALGAERAAAGHPFGGSRRRVQLVVSVYGRRPNPVKGTSPVIAGFRDSWGVWQTRSRRRRSDYGRRWRRGFWPTR